MNNASMTDRRKLLLATGGLVAMSQLLKAPVAQAQAPAQLNPQPLTPSPSWTRALPSGPDTRVKIAEAYAAMSCAMPISGRGRWSTCTTVGWPSRMCRKSSLPARCRPRRSTASACSPITSPPEQRLVACPNRTSSMAVGSLALDLSPVVVQVPDFGDRFWVYQVVDLRTDSFVQLGKMYGTRPGFYLLVVRPGKAKFPRASPRSSVPDQHRVRRAARVPGRHAGRPAGDPALLRQIMMYPLAEYDGTMKSTDWTKSRAAVNERPATRN